MKFFPQPMGYSTIVCYVREGDKLVPYRFSQFMSYHNVLGKMHPDSSVRKLEWAEIFGNHTTWVNEQVKQHNARYAAPMKQAA